MSFISIFYVLKINNRSRMQNRFILLFTTFMIKLLELIKIQTCSNVRSDNFKNITRVYVMCNLLFLSLLFYIQSSKGDVYRLQNLTVNEISNTIVDFFGVKEDHGRVKELKEKMDTINHYVINNDLFAELLGNVTRETILNETNFYEALMENDHFRYLSTNDSENLYLKMKAKMTRDDILKILAARGEQGKLMKSARRMMRNSIPKHDNDEKMSEVVDKFIAEVPKDDHKITVNESVYWDPQGALEDLKEYYDSKRDGRRLFRGERTTIRDWPFIVSIHIMGRFWCGGALYWNDLVITSASCLQLLHNNRFFRENPRVLQVRVGSNHSRVGGELIDVLEVYFHPAYNPRTLSNNLAVMRLRRHLAFTYHKIPKVIKISELPTGIPGTAEILVLGWGVTKMSQKLSFEPIYLQKKYLPVYPNTFCKEVYGKNFITEKMFCAGTITTGEGACDHDAGGPAIFAGRLIGIISFGPTVCGYTNAPTVFTLVGAYASWIKNINASMPDYHRAKRPSTTTARSNLNEFFVTWRAANLKKAYQSQAATRLVPITVAVTPLEVTDILEPEEPEEIDKTEPEPTDKQEPEPADKKEPEPSDKQEPEPTDKNEEQIKPERTANEPTDTEESKALKTIKENSPAPPVMVRMDDSEGGWSIESRK